MQQSWCWVGLGVRVIARFVDDSIAKFVCYNSCWRITSVLSAVIVRIAHHCGHNLPYRDMSKFELMALNGSRANVQAISSAGSIDPFVCARTNGFDLESSC